MPKTPRGYVPLDMHYLRDEKIRRAGPDAELLFLRSLAHCKASQTDGRIADYDLDVVGVGLKALPARVSALIHHGLWQEVKGGWVIPSWPKWNLTQTEVETARQAKRDAAILTNHKRYHRTDVDAECPHCEQPVTQLHGRRAQG